MIQYAEGIHSRLQMSPFREMERFDTDTFECVRRSSVCCVRIIRDFHGSDVRAPTEVPEPVNRHRLPRLRKKDGAELETIHRA
jgi:hypothetical protein